MDTFSIFAIILSGLFLLWALCVFRFAGDKYMAWYYMGSDTSSYDRGKFKTVHVLCLVAAALCLLLMGLSGKNWFIPLLVMIASLIIQYVLLFTFCKKK